MNRYEFRHSVVAIVLVLLVFTVLPLRGAESSEGNSSSGAKSSKSKSARAAESFEGQFFRGKGDVQYIKLLDIARRMFSADPEFQNLPMLYTPGWNGLVEGPTWGAWWIQNSYGTTYCALPFCNEPFITFLQNSQDCWFNHIGDGKKIYEEIESIPGLRPHNVIIPNYPTLDDMYTAPKGLWSFGTWVNGGHWSTWEARMIMAYYRVGAYNDARKSMEHMLTFARKFRMDNPLVNFGAAVYQPGEPINLCYDSFGPPAALIRGLFEYKYTSDGLTLVPRIPPGIVRLEQRFPIRFGKKKLYLSIEGTGPITSVLINNASGSGTKNWREDPGLVANYTFDNKQEIKGQKGVFLNEGALNLPAKIVKDVSVVDSTRGGKAVRLTGKGFNPLLRSTLRINPTLKQRKNSVRDWKMSSQVTRSREMLIRSESITCGKRLDRLFVE